MSESVDLTTRPEAGLKGLNSLFSLLKYNLFLYSLNIFSSFSHFKLIPLTLYVQISQQIYNDTLSR